MDALRESGLDKPALVRILTEPKNAIIKQYQKLLHLDRAELVFTTDALDAAAQAGPTEFVPATTETWSFSCAYGSVDAL